MRFGILSQWFDPEPGPAALPGVLARGLRDRGHSVQVLTGFPNYPTGKITAGYRQRRRLDETIDGVAVRRVALYPSHDNSVPGRMANYASFAASAIASGLGAFRDVDAIWVYNSPITVSLPSWAARLTMRIPSVVHVMDLWPDALLASGFTRNGFGHRAAEAVLNPWCRTIYRSASSIAYISPGVGQALQQRGVRVDKLHYVPLWADERIFRPSDEDLRREWGISDETIVLLYAGALGEAQGLSALVDACAAVDHPHFLCLIAGSGTAEQHLREQAARVGVANIRFLGRLPAHDMTPVLATSDLTFISLRPHPLSRITMPSKTQSALASGRAILVAARGDVARVASDSAAGWAVDPGDPAAIAEGIRLACAAGRAGLADMGRNGRRYYERTFSADRGVDHIESLLIAAARSSGAGARNRSTPLPVR
jgi:colanic acid biosynthesis glycosyl transferase WcaI